MKVYSTSLLAMAMIALFSFFVFAAQKQPAEVGPVTPDNCQSALKEVALAEYDKLAEESAKGYGVSTAIAASDLVKKTRANWVAGKADTAKRLKADLAEKQAWQMAAGIFTKMKTPKARETFLSTWNSSLKGDPGAVRWQIHGMWKQWDRAFLTPALEKLFRSTTDAMLIHAFCMAFGQHGEQGEKQLLIDKLDSLKATTGIPPVELAGDISNIQAAIDKITDWENLGDAGRVGPKRVRVGGKGGGSL